MLNVVIIIGTTVAVIRRVVQITTLSLNHRAQCLSVSYPIHCFPQHVINIIISYSYDPIMKSRIDPPKAADARLFITDTLWQVSIFSLVDCFILK